MATLALEDLTLLTFQPLDVANLGTSCSFMPGASFTVPLLPVFLRVFSPVALTTVTAQLAVCLPSAEATVMVAAPALTPVTVPFEAVATESSLLLQVRPWSVASSGATAAVSAALLPSSSFRLAELRATPVTGMASFTSATLPSRASQPVAPASVMPYTQVAPPMDSLERFAVLNRAG